MKRRTPIQRKTPLSRVSPQMRYNLEAYLVFKPNYLRRHPYCEVSNCLKPSEEIHHMRGRGRHGSLLTDELWLMAICREHHRWIHDHPNLARKKKLLLDTLQ